MLVLTQNYRDSGLSNLIPIGIGHVWVYSIKGRDYAQVCARLATECGHATHMFRARFKWSVSGHPNNGNWSCELIGDLYTDKVTADKVADKKDK